MANNVLTAKNAPGVTSALVAARISEAAKFIGSIDKEDDAMWRKQYQSANPGDTVYIKKQPRFTVGSSLDITSNIQDIQEEKVPLTLDKLSVVAFQMDSLEIAYNRPISYWYENFVKPAVDAEIADLEKWAMNKAAYYTNQLAGTAGTQPGAIDDFMLAKQYAMEQGMPEDDMANVMMSWATNNATVSARKGLFNNQGAIGEQYKTGVIAQADGLNYRASNLVPKFTNGTATGAVTVTTTSVNGATTIALTGTGTQTLKQGQTFTVASRYAVHPLTKVAYPYLQRFTILADNTAVGGAFTGVQISPTIYDAATGGSLQNISSLPTSGDVVTLFGVASTTYTQNLLYHKDAFRFVSVPLDKPTGVEFASSEIHNGIAVNVVRFFDGRLRKNIMRFDVLAGLAAVRPEWSARVTGLN